MKGVVDTICVLSHIGVDQKILLHKALHYNEKSTREQHMK